MQDARKKAVMEEMEVEGAKAAMAAPGEDVYNLSLIRG
jgi:hypothetical protein